MGLEKSVFLVNVFRIFIGFEPLNCTALLVLFSPVSVLFQSYSVLFQYCSVLFQSYSVLFQYCSVLFQSFSILFQSCFSPVQSYVMNFTYLELESPRAPLGKLIMTSRGALISARPSLLDVFRSSTIKIFF